MRNDKSELGEEFRLERPMRRTFARLHTARRRIATIAAAIAVLAVFYVLLAVNVRGEVLELSVGDVSRDTILAPRAVEDTISTQAARAQAQAAVSEKYVQDQSETQAVLTDLQNCFMTLDAIRVQAESDRESVLFERQQAASVTPVPPTPVPAVTPDGTLDPLATATPDPTPTPSPTPTPTPAPQYQDGYHVTFLVTAQDQMPNFFSHTDLMNLLEMDDSEFVYLQDVVFDLVEVSLESGIKEGLLETEITKLSDNLTNPLLNLSPVAQRLGMEMVNQYMRANLFSDEQATLAAREEAATAVPAVIVREGQAIVREGEVVTEAQYAMLVSLGLISGESEIPWQVYATLAVLLGLMALILGMYLRYFERREMDEKYHALLWLAVILTTGVVSFLAQQVHPYLSVAPLCAMLIACLFNRRMAMASQAVMTLYTALTAYMSGGAVLADMAALMIGSLLAGTLTVNLLNKRSSRSAFVWVGFAAGAVYAAVYGGFAVLQGTMDARALGSFALLGLANGILSGMLALGSLPIWEALFGLNTTMKMMELCNPNQPLLKRLLVEAPGTYHHSVIVGNLAEAAAEEIGCNPMLVRVGAYYHDIGKLTRPIFFKENQHGPNPHDSITPELSSRILLAHVSDGVEMARKARLPQEIIDMIETHHGDTMQAYFWYKAKQTSEDPDSLKEEDFRYPGPKPSTREAALIMMADSVEAAVRSLKHPTPEGIETMVRNVIKGKFNDNQLDHCDVTLRDIERITQVFIRILHSVYHERIEYPNMDAVKGEK